MQYIKKRYLLQNSIQSLIKDLKLQRDTISYFFTKTDSQEEIKYSKLNKKFYKSSNSLEKQISKKSYKRAKKDKITKIIKKQRYYLLLDGKKYIIDRYKKDLKDLNVLEIEFENENEYKTFLMPDFLQDFIIKEIVDDKILENSQNKTITLFENSNRSSYNIYEIFKKLQRGEINSLDEIISKDMPSIDALRIVLYKLFLCLKEDSNRLIASNSNKNLYSFRSNLTKIENILNTFDTIFDNQNIQKISSNLIHTLNVTNTLQNLESLKDHLSQIKENLDQEQLSRLEQFIMSIKESLKNEKFKIRTFLTSREAQIIFKQLEVFIKEDIQSNDNGKTPIYPILQEKLTKKLKKLKKLFNTLDKSSFEDLKSCLILFSKFYNICSEFVFLFDKESLQEFFKHIKDAENKIELFFELEKKRLIYNTYIEDLQTYTLDYERLRVELDFDISKQQSTLLDDIKNSIQSISKKTFQV